MFKKCEIWDVFKYFLNTRTRYFLCQEYHNLRLFDIITYSTAKDTGKERLLLSNETFFYQIVRFIFVISNFCSRMKLRLNLRNLTYFNPINLRKYHRKCNDQILIL